MNISDLKQGIRQQMRYIDRTYWVLFIGLIIWAIIALFSASSTLAFKEEGGILGPILSQIVFILVGVAAVFVIQSARCRDQRSQTLATNHGHHISTI